MKIFSQVNMGKGGLGASLLAIVFTLVVTATVQADPFLFDPDGPGALPVQPTNTFDQLPGNSLSVGGVISQVNCAPGPSGACTTTIPFSTLYQARLGAITNPFGADITPPALNQAGGFEITFVARFPEVTSFEFGPPPGTPGASTFISCGPGCGTASATNFFEIYFDPSVDASDLAGVGFNDVAASATTPLPAPYGGPAPGPLPGPGPIPAGVAGGSTLIMSGFITTANTNFSTTACPAGGPTANLDGFGGVDNYGPGAFFPPNGLDSTCGTGSTSLTGGITFANPLWFPQGLNAFALTIFTTTNVLPFTAVDPSARFVLAPGGAVPVPDGAGSPFTSIGAVNGSFPNSGCATAPVCPDVQFQADASQTFTLRVPEPSSWFLIGTGLIGMAAFLRRKTRKQD